MPFTPFHLGPGMAVKAAAPRQFSIVTFALTQIAFDLEVLWYLLRGAPTLHRFWHSWIGATIIAVVLTVLGKPASQWIKSFWNRIAAKCRDADLAVKVHTTWLASLLGACVGAYSHIFLDGIFHPDVEPFQPWSASNPLHGLINPRFLELLCILLGIAGLAGYVIGERKRKRTDGRAEQTGSRAQRDRANP